MKTKKKKDREYMAILDRPIEELIEKANGSASRFWRGDERYITL